MKFVFSLLLTVLTCWQMPLTAVETHHLSIDGSKIELNVMSPENFVEAKIADLDLVFQDPEDPGRKLCFHYFLDPNFNLGSVNGVLEYIDWLMGKIFVNSGRSSVSISTGKGSTQYSFMTKDSNDIPVYCFVYIGKIDGELIFSSIGTSYKGFDEVKQDNIRFLETITWEKGPD